MASNGFPPDGRSGSSHLPGSSWDEGIERWLGDLERPFPWEEVEWNRCALQLAAQTGLDEIHNLFSFMSMGHVWITQAGQLQGVITDRILIAACLHAEEREPSP